MWFVAAALAQSYSTTELTIGVPERSNAEWAQQMKAKARARKNKVEWVWRDPDSGEEVLVLDRESGTRDLGRPALVASWMAYQGRLDPGTEYDLVLGAGNDEGMRPVTLWFESKSRIVVSAGPSIGLPGEGPPMEEVVKASGVAGFSEDGAEFAPRLRTVIAESFAMLTEAERSWTREITLFRQAGKGPGARKNQLHSASYAYAPDEARITFFDDVLVPSGRFVGSVQKPWHPGYFVVLHELGHALDMARVEAAVRAYNADVEAFNALPGGQRTQAKADALEARRKGLRETLPTSDGFRERFAGITDYGATDDREAFAESFALYKLDPEALRRISPEALAWFEAGEHLP